MLKNNKGFSMIELMVVVAIIGIIMTISLPNYQKFKSKAKQTSAKAELTGVFMTEQNFSIEYGKYHNNLAYVGYTPDGIPVNLPNAAGEADKCPSKTASEYKSTRYYKTGFVAGADDSPVSSLPINCGSTQFYPDTVGAGSITGASTAVAGKFTASAQGLLDGSPDRWEIDQNKSLTNTTNGAQ